MTEPGVLEREGKRYIEIPDPVEEEFKKIKDWPQKWEIDEEIQGTYIKHRSNVGPNHSHVYRLENTDGCFDIWGTTGLNSRFNNKESPIPIGSELIIIYKGERPSQPPHKPFKKFQIFTLETNGDDEEAQIWIRDLANEMRTQKVDVNAENIKRFAQLKQELFEHSDEELDRIYRQVDIDDAKRKQKMNKQRLV